MQDSSAVVRVFLPKSCLQQRTGLLVGCFENNWSVVTGLVGPLENSDEIENFKLPGDSGYGFIGQWLNDENESQASTIGHLNGIMPINRSLVIHASSTGILAASWNITRLDNRDTDSSSSLHDIVVILFDELTFTTSAFMSDICVDNSFPCTNAEIIASSIHLHRRTFDIQNEKFLRRATDLVRKPSSNLSKVTSVIYSIQIVILSAIVGIFSHISSLRIVRHRFFNTVVFTPSVTRQLRCRYDTVRTRLQSTTQTSRTHRRQMSVTDCVWLHVLDVFLGVIVTLWLMQDDTTASIAHSLIIWAEMVAVELERLLNWLMGAPAGLKLNETLAHFLGHFFLYHIFLWKAYLGALQPVLASVIYYGTCLTGVLGFTIQLSIVQDLISMMTLHIYCFYVYAARLYNLQVYSLSSLWRLFFGRKWNVLRKRVDSASYDIDQLFIGTLLFTILLFLLPTTALFYVVFAMLRVLVLLVQGVLYKVVGIINSLSVYWVFLRAFESDIVAGDVHLSISQTSPLCLLLKLSPVSMSRLLFISTNELDIKSSSTDANTWKCLSKKLLMGELIYPWVEPTCHTS